MAPLPELITDLGWDMIHSLPPILQEDPDYIAIMHCASREIALLEAAIELVRAQGNPLTATELGLPFWELLLGLATDLTLDVQARRDLVVNKLQALNSANPGSADWRSRVNQRLSGVPWTWVEHVTGSDDPPDAQTLLIRLPFTPGSTAWDNALKVFDEETPAELVLTFESSSGFILDQSQLDVEGMGV